MLFWVVGVQVKVMGGNPMWFPGLEAWINSFIKNEVLRWVAMPFASVPGYRVCLGACAILLRQGFGSPRVGGVCDLRVLSVGRMGYP